MKFPNTFLFLISLALSSSSYSAIRVGGIAFDNPLNGSGNPGGGSSGSVDLGYDNTAIKIYNRCDVKANVNLSHFRTIGGDWTAMKYSYVTKGWYNIEKNGSRTISLGSTFDPNYIRVEIGGYIAEQESKGPRRWFCALRENSFTHKFDRLSTDTFDDFSKHQDLCKQRYGKRATLRRFDVISPSSSIIGRTLTRKYVIRNCSN